MRLQLKPYPWSCLATSFAMVLDIDVQEFFELTGHTGSEIVFQRAEPMCRRGHHIDEAIRVCLLLGRCVTPVELFPGIAATTQIGMQPQSILVCYPNLASNWVSFANFIATTSGVMEGRGITCNHAVAYSKGRIYDPDGREYDYSPEACEARHFYGRKLWIIK